MEIDSQIANKKRQIKARNDVIENINKAIENYTNALIEMSKMNMPILNDLKTEIEGKNEELENLRKKMKNEIREANKNVEELNNQKNMEV